MHLNVYIVVYIFIYNYIVLYITYKYITNVIYKANIYIWVMPKLHLSKTFILSRHDRILNL